eukprot:GHVS01000250.1.p1 GENE.GHVS01000250.1~~GHVS01000250.1.p1  ORF type:complete len:547 (-),score=115.77 GHVS01000250.1:171-1658(-)
MSPSASPSSSLSSTTSTVVSHLVCRFGSILFHHSPSSFCSLFAPLMSRNNQTTPSPLLSLIPRLAPFLLRSPSAATNSSSSSKSTTTTTTTTTQQHLSNTKQQQQYDHRRGNRSPLSFSSPASSSDFSGGIHWHEAVKLLQRYVAAAGKQARTEGVDSGGVWCEAGREKVWQLPPATANDELSVGLGRVWFALFVLYGQRGEEDGLANVLDICQTNSFEYEGHFGLRFCEERHLHRTAVALFGLMGLYEECVEESLKVGGFKVAKLSARQAADESVKTRLWRLIAEYIAKTGESSELLSLVAESDGVLRIQDILPYMDDGVLVEEIRDHICSALDIYQQKISANKHEMEEHRKAASSLKQDIKAVNQRCVVVSVSKKCDSCRELVFAEKFYAFPCGHCFHATCAQTLKCHSLSVEECQNYNLLARALEEAVGRGAAGRDIALIESELDAIVGEECLLCGSCLVKSITEPFILPDGEDGEEVDSWSVRPCRTTAAT